MKSWTWRIARSPGAPSPSHRALTAPRVRRDDELLVLQHDAHVFRAAHVTRRDRHVAPLAQDRGELAHCLAFLRARRTRGTRRVVLVTPEARLELVRAPDDCEPGVETARLVARMDHADRRRWSETLRQHGLALEAVYPLGGSALGALSGDESALCVQIEHGLVAVMELIAGRCAEIDLHQDAEPSAERIQELVGTACPEVILCGGGANLSELGYALARGGSTWVRILRPRMPEPAGTELAALFGAARHACGLVPAERQARIVLAR